MPKLSPAGKLMSLLGGAGASAYAYGKYKQRRIAAMNIKFAELTKEEQEFVLDIFRGALTQEQLMEAIESDLMTVPWRLLRDAEKQVDFFSLPQAS